MAKARATCTCATCGAEFEMSKILRNRSEANSWEEWVSANVTECASCREARHQRERDAENAAAKAAAEEAGLPELTGSEKQVAWATTIRQKAHDSMSRRIQQDENLLKSLVQKGRERAAVVKKNLKIEKAFFSWLFSAKTAAHWWIDHRNMAEASPVMIIQDFLSAAYKIRDEFQAAMQAGKNDAEEKPMREAARAETTVKPENQTHEGRVEIRVTESAVTAKYPKNDDFRAVVKSLGYTWDGTSGEWAKRITVTTGTAQERAAELGNKLLNAGFAVCIADPETRQAAIEGRYEPEHQRWITRLSSGQYEGWFCISLAYGDGMYEKARAIPGARYDKPNVVVPAKEWEAVADFASLYDYRPSPGAREIIERQQSAVIVVMPAPARAAVYAEHDPAEIMQGSADVLDDLRDDP